MAKHFHYHLSYSVQKLSGFSYIEDETLKTYTPFCERQKRAFKEKETENLKEKYGEEHKIKIISINKISCTCEIEDRKND